MNIGSVQVFLQPVAYMVEMKEQLEITDLKGNKIGVMNVSILKYIVNIARGTTGPGIASIT